MIKCVSSWRRMQQETDQMERHTGHAGNNAHVGKFPRFRPISWILRILLGKVDYDLDRRSTFSTHAFSNCKLTPFRLRTCSFQSRLQSCRCGFRDVPDRHLRPDGHWRLRRRDHFEAAVTYIFIKIHAHRDPSPYSCYVEPPFAE